MDKTNPFGIAKHEVWEVLSTARATSSGEKMAPSRSTSRMMQVTEAAFQAECA
jgi:hypothetical protein